ncbi:MAG TPA: AAA family ATPase [Polyangiales bacterium]|nr:AAA family ATPase [Polyangiales bacterium]
MTEAINEPILEGNLADFNLVEVLQVLSLSRQYTRVEVFSDDRHLAGSIFIKSGKVVQASHGALRGKKAFASLIRRPPSRFRVFRINTPALIPEPVGSLSNLLIEAIEEEAAPVTSAPSARAPQKPRTVPAPASQLPSLGRPASMRPLKRTHSGVHALKTSTGPCVIAIASPKGGSGKTTVALNLALSLARREHRVILVDGDVNGDVMSSIDGRTEPKAGAFDVIAGGAAPADALRKTVVPNLEILPAIGQSLPSPEIAFVDYRDRWQLLFNELVQHAEIVIVDTPAGMFGVTYQILSAASHVIGVLQAEVIAHRSFSMFADCLGLLPEPARPKVLGVFLNMLQLRHSASIDVLARACEKLPKEWLFETSIPRNAAFLDSTAAGVPLHLYDLKHPPAVSWLFDTFAAEVLDRLALATNEVQIRQRRFLA